MIFETMFSLAENLKHEYRANNITKESQQAIQDYISYLYDSNWKRQIDQWVIADGISKLFAAGIKFSIEPGLLWDHWPRDDFNNSLPSYIDPISIRPVTETAGHATYLYPLQDKDKDPGYHGEPESQEYLADIYYKIIKDLK